MVKTYRKGYVFERQLLHLLAGHGFMVMRAPRSGRIGLPSPDLIAVRNGKIMVIECKARVNGFTVPATQLQELVEWEKAGALVYVGWKPLRKAWVFIKLNKVMENRGNVGKRFADNHGVGIDEIVNS